MKLWERIPEKRRIWVWIGLGLLAVILLATLLWPKRQARELTGENLLKDGNFAEYALKGSGAWYEDAYVNRSTYTAYDFVTEADGGVSAHIVNMLANDARFAQIVDVRPDSLYCLEGDVKASAQGGLGANLSIEGPYVFSDTLYDQPEWTHIRLYGRTSPDQRSVTVFARLGGYSGEATGEAWFRNLSLTEVAEVPEGYRTYDWYQKSASSYAADDADDAVDVDPGALAHGLAMALALLVYGAMIWYTLRRADRTKPLEASALWLFALFAGALLIRLAVALLVRGYDVDIGDFSAWATEVAVRGPNSFYRLDLDAATRSQMYICDYPPGYILLLGLIGLLGQWFETGVTEFMVKFLPILADLGMGWVLYRWLLSANGKRKGPKAPTAFILASVGLLLFNPLLLLTGAGWGQSDSVMMFFLMLTLYFGMRKRWSLAIPFYLIAVLMKPQALMFGPLGLVALYLNDREAQKDHAQYRALVPEIVTGLAAMLVVAVAVVLPFALGHGLGWLFELYGKTMSYYAYVTVNACNLYFLTGANWTGLGMNAPRWFGWAALVVMGIPLGGFCLTRRKTWDTRKMLIPLAALGCTLILALVGTVFSVTWQFWSTALMALIIALSLALCVQSGAIRHLPLYGGLLMTGLFAMGGMMHERYLFPAIPLLLWAWRIEDDDRILLTALLATAGCFLNAGCVLSRNVRIGGADGHLTIPWLAHESDMGFLEYLAAVLNVCAFSVTCWLSAVHAQDNTPWHLAVRAVPRKADGPVEPSPQGKRVTLGSRIMTEELGGDRPAHRLDRMDVCVILVITGLYAVLAFYHLGSMTSPQNGYEFHAHYTENPAYQTDAEAAEEAEADSLPDTEETVALAEQPEENWDETEWDEGDWDENAWDEEGWASADEDADQEEEYILVTESVTFDLGAETSDFRMLYMGGVHQYDSAFTVETSADGETWSAPVRCAMNIGDLFQWLYARSNRGARGLSLDGRYVRLTSLDAGLTLMEVLFRDAEGNVLPVKSAVSSMGHDVSALLDEQDTLTGEPGWFNSMYFDEIYHARTAYEHWVGMTPYENTHPPLGKVMMSWCVGLFGMTPFAWRFAGTLAGVLMLPGLYLMARLLFKKRRYAVMCCLMLALDTLHYTQTRLATIDSYVVLFIIWSYYFMFRWLLTDFFGQPLRRTLVPLALSGLMMGLAVASKWTGCYAGVGLAILFFIGVGRRWYAARQAEKAKGGTEPRQETARGEGTMRILITVASCLIWFVAVPALIYYLSYIPYFAPNGGVSVRRIISAAEGMLTYHSQPGLGMDHPYYSPWYEWPFAIAKPMYYAADHYEPAGYACTILAFGNIAVWWVGFACMLATLAALLWKQAGGLLRGYRPDAPASALSPAGEYDRRPLMLVIAFAAQYLPWTLVPRGTYIYHYFPSVPFIILSAGLIFEYMENALTEAAVQRAVARGGPDMEAPTRRRADRLGLLAVIVYLVIVLALFVAFFPYASGILTPTGWLDAMNWFKNLYY